MGFEYQFVISDEDRKRLKKNPCKPNTMDEIFKSAPGFQGKKGSEYWFDYSEIDDGWCHATLEEKEGSIYLCFHRSKASFDDPLFRYLTSTFLDELGRVQLSEL